MKKAGLAKYIISIFIAFCIFISLFCLNCVAILHFTVLSENKYQKTASTSGYVYTALDELQEIYRSYASASGFNPDEIVTFINAKDIEDAFNHNIRYYFQNENSLYDYSVFQNNMFNKLYQSIEKNNITITDDINDGIDTTAAVYTEYFRMYTSPKIFSFIISSFLPFNKIVTIACFCFLGLAIILSIVLFLINRVGSSFYRFYICICIGLIIMQSLPIIYGAYTNIAQRINIEPLSIKLIFTDLIQSVFHGFGVGLGVAAFFLCIFLLLFFYKHKKRVNKLTAKKEKGHEYS